MLRLPYGSLSSWITKYPGKRAGDAFDRIAKCLAKYAGDAFCQIADMMSAFIRRASLLAACV